MKTIKDVGSLAYMVDKWDVKKSAKRTQAGQLRWPMRSNSRRCRGTDVHWEARRKVRVLSDGSWKGSGTCTYTYEGGTS